MEQSYVHLGKSYNTGNSRSPFLERGQVIRFYVDGEVREGTIVGVEKDVQRDVEYVIEDNQNEFHTIGVDEVANVLNQANSSWGSE